MEILLQQHELLDLGGKLQNVTIVCQSGCCWLTQTGDSRDHILHAGSHVKIHSQGRVIVTASDDCRLRVVADATEESSGRFWRDLCCNN